MYVRPSPLEIGKWALDFIAGTLDSSSMINFGEFNDTATWETSMTSCVVLNSNFGFPIEPRRLWMDGWTVVTRADRHFAPISPFWQARVYLEAITGDE